jgi:hypothetical protein
MSGARPPTPVSNRPGFCATARCDGPQASGPSPTEGLACGRPASSEISSSAHAARPEGLIADRVRNRETTSGARNCRGFAVRGPRFTSRCSTNCLQCMRAVHAWPVMARSVRFGSGQRVGTPARDEAATQPAPLICLSAPPRRRAPLGCRIPREGLSGHLRASACDGGCDGRRVMNFVTGRALVPSLPARCSGHARCRESRARSQTSQRMPPLREVLTAWFFSKPTKQRTIDRRFLVGVIVAIN